MNCLSRGLRNLEPVATFTLGDELKEVSGLAYHEPSHSLIGINDENGVYHFISTSTGKLQGSVDFDYDGDFEGIEWFDGKLYILRSDRELLSYDPESLTMTSLLSKKKGKSEYEGLCYDPYSSQMLLARKRGDEKGKPIWIYSFDPTSPSGKTEKYIEIDLSEMVKKWEEKPLLSDKKKRRIKTFAPSGIAVHPHTNDLYILSAQGEMLLILTSKGKFKELCFLPSKKLPQPEGICFDKDALLYIASEGQKREGRILVFERL